MRYKLITQTHCFHALHAILNACLSIVTAFYDLRRQRSRWTDRGTLLTCLPQNTARSCLGRFTMLLALISALVSPLSVRSELLSIEAITLGSAHTCVLLTNGAMQCWGMNDVGQLGDGSTTNRLNPTNVVDLTSGVAEISAGDRHTCGVTTSGGAKCWGYNGSGRLGDGSTVQRTSAVDVVGLTSGVSRISSGRDHTCAITTDGGAKCWGSNSQGQLGDGTTTSRLTPIDVVGLASGVSQISAGKYHTCVLTTSGGAKCWGRNSEGQLGDGSTVQRTSPIDVTGLTSSVSHISAGQEHSCAVTDAGSALCWGDNYHGRLGDGSTTSRSTPTAVTGLSAGISMISAGDLHSCAISTSMVAKCWGNNSQGELGNTNSALQTTPADVVSLSSQAINISLGSYYTCAILTSGAGRCWGINNVGQLGNGTTNTRYLPTDVPSLSSGLAKLSLGHGSHTCIVTTAGGAKCWGYNAYGQIGDGSNTYQLAPTDVSSLTSDVISITLGESHTCALTSNGGVKCWGYNSDGQLGDNSKVNKLTPVNVTGLTSGASTVLAGNYHTCALTTAGGAKCWGWSNFGQVGNGSTSDQVTPQNVTGLTSGVQSMSVGRSFACVVTTAGGAKCWGSNYQGNLGDGSTTDRTTPVDVVGLTTGVSAISAGDEIACAVTTSGAVKCWGTSNLGDGATTSSYSPVDVPALSSGVTSIYAGSTSTASSHICAITSSNNVFCWGDNTSGELGNGSNSPSNFPIAVASLTSGISQFAPGDWGNCILTSAGGAQCWGLSLPGITSDLSLKPILRGLSAQGQVTLSGSPLSGVALSLTNMGALYANQEFTTDGSGAYALAMTETVPYTITPSLDGYTFSPPSITGTMSEDLNQDFVATLITYNITGTVTANSNPLAGATVDGGGLGTQVTDGSGAYSFTAILPATAYTLTVSHPGATFGVSTASGTLNAHATHDFSGTLTTHSIAGTITAGGSPLSGVSIDGGALGNTTTDGSGNYGFASIDYGTNYTITPSLTDYVFSPMSASGTLTGNVTADFTAVYSPPTTTSVSTTSTTTSTVAPSTTTAALTTSPTTSPTTSVDVATTTSSTSPTSTTSLQIAPSTTTAITTTSAITTTTTTTAPTDSDGDGLTDSEEAALGTNPEVSDSDDDGVTDGEENSTGTNPKDPGSKSPKLRATLCSDWNGYLGGMNGRGMYNIMEHINLTTRKLRVKTELRSIRGHLKDTYEFFLRGNQQFDLLVHDMAGREVNSYGQVCTTYERAPVGSPVGNLDGRMVYYKYGDDGDIQFAFALPFENPARGKSAMVFNTQQPSLDARDSANLVANWVQLSNVSKKRLKGTLSFHSLSGTTLGTYSVNLRDGARYDYSGHAWGTNAGLVRFEPEDEPEDNPVDNRVDYQLRTIRYLYDNPGGAESFSSAYPFSSAVGSGESLITPVDTTAGSAVLELANTLNKKVAVAIKLYDKTGKKELYAKTHALKAYSSLHLPLDALLVSTTGLITAKGSHTGSIIGSVVHYGRTESDGVKNMFALPLSEPVGTTFKGSYNSYLNQGCTLYLANSSTARETVTIALKQNDGTSPVKDYKLIVPGHGVLSENLCSKSPVNVYGVVTVTANKAKRISGYVVRKGENERYKMATALR